MAGAERRQRVGGLEVLDVDLVEVRAGLVELRQQVVVGRAALGHGDLLALEVAGVLDLGVLGNDDRVALGPHGVARPPRHLAVRTRRRTAAACSRHRRCRWQPALSASRSGGPDVNSFHFTLYGSSSSAPDACSSAFDPPFWSPTVSVTLERSTDPSSRTASELSAAALAQPADAARARALRARPASAGQCGQEVSGCSCGSTSGRVRWLVRTRRPGRRAPRS